MSGILSKLFQRAGRKIPSGTWIETNILACAYPRSELALAELSAEGISVLINLELHAHEPEVLSRIGLSQIHLPTPDFAPPSIADLERGVAAIEQSVGAGKRVAIHCRAGLGRTGTLLACYLVHRNFSPEAAIGRIRKLRPGSVETAEQENAVREFAFHSGRGKSA